MIKIKNNSIFIIMYHYVRLKKNTDYYKSFSIHDFKKQIKFFKKRGRIICHDEIKYILDTKKFNKETNFLLTFDDGYIDHYNNVLPVLLENKIKANFYPPTSIWKKNKVLDVNKIHIILNYYRDHRKILNFIYQNLSDKEKKIFSIDKIQNKILKNDYDKKETLILKRLLQNILPPSIKNSIMNTLWDKVTSNIDEKIIHSKLYMSLKMAKEMTSKGMHFGLHTEDHTNLKLLNEKEQISEIKKNELFLKKNFKNYDHSLCFPWGEYNKFSKKIFNNPLIKYGLTIKPGYISRDNSFNKNFLLRFDANNLKL